MATLNATATGISPTFPITNEELQLDYNTSVTKIDIDGVQPPTFGPDGGYSRAMDLRNLWFPWIDEPIVPARFDGVCFYLGAVSNRPTFIKDYLSISLMRATDYILEPVYQGMLRATVDGVIPIPPPSDSE
jgi:hypothetical protein